MKVVIIGGVAGGASTAARLRRLNENVSIVVLEKSGYVSFANCGLPYHISGVISERERLLLESVESLSSKFNIDIRVKTEVISIERSVKKITVQNLDTGEIYEESYDKLVISTGAESFIPGIKGLTENNYMKLRNIEDMDKIVKYVNKHKPKNAVVVGGGFIGIEIVENLKHIGIDLAVIEKANQLMTPVDYEMASFVHSELKRSDIGIYLESEIIEITENKNEKILKLSTGEEITTEMLIISIGVNPDSKLAINAGIKTNDRGSIVVNEYLGTSDENIYAVGDVVEVNNPIVNDKMFIPLAGPANKQGRIVAENIIGRKSKYNGTIGTSILKVFDLTIAATGVTEKYLKSKNIDHKSFIIVKSNHASYYPNSSDIIFKLIFDRKNGKIYGAQSVGYEGVDKRIDIIATAIKGNLTVFDLKEIEVAYAPSFNSAKDIVNYAGFMSENIIYDEMDLYKWNSDKQVEFIDVRTFDEYEIDHINGAKNIPLNEIRNRLDELDKNKEYVVYCKIGLRGYNAQRILKNNGYNVLNLDGGLTVYKNVMKNQNNKKIFKKKESDVKMIENEENKMKIDNIIKLDTCGLQCPGPILKVKELLLNLNNGEVIEVISTDQGFESDIKSWVKKNKNTLISIKNENKKITAIIKKGNRISNAEVLNMKNESKMDKSTMVVFSGDFDKVFASLIIANGSLAMGNEATMFFTFWGLNALRKNNYNTKLKKSVIEKIFCMMMPKGLTKLRLSKMHYFGLGKIMMNFVMKSKNIETLESLLHEFLKNGGKIIACTMSMDVMGIKNDELIEGVEFGGVATYMDDASDSNHNLFI
ncbi:MAG: FAD-dependent oxidoreductase [Leptotrichiaceae bacterium]|nr:FAD-dependent oxidoreductase [Leptotrichiaceae bacterium]MBP6281545.1 FAD-dependent oxidoreductase [Leptotrichiaceae bacterium]MBP7100894.1 FAD-dependent oxidoreductase [Leptotrichiaceae bacterium]MBP7725528.1 FAD-dependent oxidoreductase [Leptotrichiaceae bacterium]MBP9630171.1 FAD-dependent oxidoreductase [Leptotrichiaceae bacterium]